MNARRLNRESGLIDGRTPLSFRFDGRTFSGFRGDTLASALLANGVRVVGRSFKYHRPRGIVGFSAEEPNALVEVGEGSWREPNTRATQVGLYEGLVAKSQNRWPSLALDVLALNNLFSPLLSAGFYYKTFKWPPSWWPTYEHVIRKAAGLGRPTVSSDPAEYDARWHHTDVLVVGAGPAGLSAALAAAGCGARVMLIDEEARPGGFLRRERINVADLCGDIWAARVWNELSSMEDVVVLPRTAAFGIYDHNFVGAVQRLSEPGQERRGRASQRVWKIRAKEIIVATGAIERPLVIPGNDIPGVMLASASRGYLNAFSVAAGSRVVVVTNNDDAYKTVADFCDAGVDVCAVVDSRKQLSEIAKPFADKVRSAHAVLRVLGGSKVRGVEIRPLDGQSIEHLKCDLVCLSGGYTPSVHLYMHAKGQLRWSEEIATFVPTRALESIHVTGGAAGLFDLPDVLAQGTDLGLAAAEKCGYTNKLYPCAVADAAPRYRVEPFWHLPASWTRLNKAFVDFQNDVTEHDVSQARDEGYVSVEHLKRYTTLGMGTDQGKTSNVNGLALMAIAEGRTIPNSGTTTFRPPYTPVTLSALAGGRVGVDIVPVRRTALSEVLAQEGAIFMNSGHWRRAHYFPRPGETMEMAARREASAVRRSAGVTEVSTLGKFEISGAGASALLDRVYATPVRSLAVGRARWGLMLHEDGMVFDDGTLWRLGEERFLVTSSTANASAVHSHLEYVRDVVMPHLDVDVACVSEQWAGVAVAGPHSGTVLRELLSAWDATPRLEIAPLDVREFETRDFTLRIARISFSGERAYEIYISAGRASHLWRTIRDVGTKYDLIPYGLESLEYLRVEKGFLGAGHEINGRTTPDDLGFQKMLKKSDGYLGAVGLRRPALRVAGRLQLVGLVAQEEEIPEGAHLVSSGSKHSAESEGHVTSAGHSVALQTGVALGLLANGRARHGETLVATDPVRSRRVSVRVSHPVFYDAEGTATRG